MLLEEIVLGSGEGGGELSDVFPCSCHPKALPKGPTCACSSHGGHRGVQDVSVDCKKTACPVLFFNADTKSRASTLAN